MAKKRRGEQQETINVFTLSAEELLHHVLAIEESGALPDIPNFARLIAHLRGLLHLDEAGILKRASHDNVNHDFVHEIQRGRVPRLKGGKATATIDSRYKQLAHGLHLPEARHLAFQRLAELQQLGQWGANGAPTDRRIQALHQFEQIKSTFRAGILNLLEGADEELVIAVHAHLAEVNKEVTDLLGPHLVKRAKASNGGSK